MSVGVWPRAGGPAPWALPANFKAAVPLPRAHGLGEPLGGAGRGSDFPLCFPDLHPSPHPWEPWRDGAPSSGELEVIKPGETCRELGGQQTPQHSWLPSFVHLVLCCGVWCQALPALGGTQEEPEQVPALGRCRASARVQWSGFRGTEGHLSRGRELGRGLLLSATDNL